MAHDETDLPGVDSGGTHFGLMLDVDDVSTSASAGFVQLRATGEELRHRRVDLVFAPHLWVEMTDEQASDIARALCAGAALCDRTADSPARCPAWCRCHDDPEGWVHYGPKRVVEVSGELRSVEIQLCAFNCGHDRRLIIEFTVGHDEIVEFAPAAARRIAAHLMEAADLLG
ncbi:DUF6907 domain-containing protein [Nocardia sp. NPDC059764]|uniref:DUF6907 domain-containing protein n=1 Tax=Nocardia sp. NPDC059764 TaxID=3346939 RepID=UPI00366843DA